MGEASTRLELALDQARETLRLHEQCPQPQRYVEDARRLLGVKETDLREPDDARS